MDNQLKGKQKKVKEAMRLLAILIDSDIFTAEQTFALRQAYAAIDAAVVKWTIPSYTSAGLDADLKIFANDFYNLTHTEE